MDARGRLAVPPGVAGVATVRDVGVPSEDGGCTVTWAAAPVDMPATAGAVPSAAVYAGSGKSEGGVWGAVFAPSLRPANPRKLDELRRRFASFVNEKPDPERSPACSGRRGCCDGEGFAAGRGVVGEADDGSDTSTSAVDLV